jgi:ERCC4-type nuclease
MNIKNITAVIDTREQTPLTLEYKDGHLLKSETGTLYTGDYSIKGLENRVAIERKSLDDLMGCIGTHRERFEKEIVRLRGYETRAIIVESTWKKIENGKYRSRVKPTQAIGSIMGWIAAGIPVTMAGDHKKAGMFVARMLYITARRRFNELQELL